MFRTVSRRCAWLGVLMAVAWLGATGCSHLDFIKRRLPPPQQVEDGILFQFEAPSARVVQVAGNWPENNWLAGQGQNARYDLGRMSDDDGDGTWQIIVDLPPGRYQYKYRIDEINWKEDPNNPQRTDDGFGGFNSLLIVN